MSTSSKRKSYTVRSIRKTIRSVSELRKVSYRLFDKLHDLERGTKLGSICLQSLGKEPSVVTLVLNLKILLQRSLADVTDIDLVAAVANHLSKLDRFAVEVASTARDMKAMKSRIIGPILTSHTQLFDILESRRATVRFLPMEVSDVNLVLISIWGDKVRPYF